MKKKILNVILTLTLCAGLSAPALAARTFTDVPATYWAYDAIQYVVDEGLFQGTSATTFEPGISMTRAMLIQVLYRYAGSPNCLGTGYFLIRMSPRTPITGTLHTGDGTAIFLQVNS